MRRYVAVFMVVSSAFAASADILYLRDGSRHNGKLISRTPEQVVFRILLPDGRSGITRTFPAAAVDRIEELDLEPEPADPGEESPEPMSPHATVEEYLGLLNEAFTKLDLEQSAAALRLLQRAVHGAPQGVIDALEHETRAKRDIALDELLAQTRIDVALTADRGRTFKLGYATTYEARALGRLLEVRTNRLLTRSYDGKTIEAWAGDPRSYDRLTADARRIVEDARLAAALLGARLRFDPRLRGDGSERARLSRLRSDLTRLAAQISAMHGYTAPALEGLPREAPPAADPREPAVPLIPGAAQPPTRRPTTRPTRPEAPPSDESGDEPGAPTLSDRPPKPATPPARPGEP
jgi:hypothetical protein